MGQSLLGKPSVRSKASEGVAGIDHRHAPSEQTGRANQPRAPKPTYLGLLNAIAVGEARGAELLEAWAASTPDSTLAADLTTVAIREREHAAAFAKRLHELGFAVRKRNASRFEQDLRLAASSAHDAEKFAQLLPERTSDPVSDKADPLDYLFDDHSIDPQTGALLGRFIAEERDSERILARARERSLASPHGGDEELAAIANRIDRLTATLESLKALRLDDLERRDAEGLPGR